ncbi:uncharacterized protein TNCV_977231 [Trichonephila clavipes]|nr:uncharacterized protein TNCV_977231 [Trichonephila clavipes]
MIFPTCSIGYRSGGLSGQVVPTAAQISAADAVLCAKAVRQIRRSALSVVSRGRPEPGLLEAVRTSDRYSQQSFLVDTFQLRLSAISRNKNPPSSRRITQPRSNSVSC